MKRRVMVADADAPVGSPLKQVEVSDARWRALDASLRPILPLLWGSEMDQRAIIGRPLSARDATEGYAFFVSQLAYTEQKILPRYYQPMQYTEFLPITNEAGPAATSVRYQIEDQVGNAQWADSSANDIQNVDVAWSEKSFGIHHAEVGYEFTQQEFRTTALLRAALPERRLGTAIKAYQRFLNQVGLLGSTAKNITGLYNNANVTAANRPSGAAWSGGTFANINSDFQAGMNNVFVASGFNAIPNKVIVPELAWQYIATTPASATIPEITILKWLSMNNIYTSKTGQPLSIVPGYDNSTAGSGGTPRTVFYVNDEDTLVYHVPMPLQFLAPQLAGTKVKVPGEFRLSGVEVRRVTNMYYMDGT